MSSEAGEAESAHLLLTLQPFLGEDKATLPRETTAIWGGEEAPAPPADRPLGAAALATTGSAGFTLVHPISQPNPTFKLLVSHHVTGLVFLAKPKPLLADPSDPALPQPATGDQDPIPLSQPASLALGVSKMKPAGYRAPAARRPPPASQRSLQRQPHWATWSMSWCHFS